MFWLKWSITVKVQTVDLLNVFNESVSGGFTVAPVQQVTGKKNDRDIKFQQPAADLIQKTNTDHIDW